MSQIYFLSDPHFGHRLVAHHRGFGTPDAPDVEAHDNTLAENWRKTVHPKDTVWILGDLAASSPTHALRIIADLPGVKHLIAGNHDRVSPVHRDSHRHQRTYLEVFESVQAYARRRIAGYNVMLSHYPYLGGEDDRGKTRYTQHRLANCGDWLLHGHTHLAHQRQHDGRQIHVGLDAWNLAPISIDVIEDMILTYEQENA